MEEPGIDGAEFHLVHDAKTERWQAKRQITSQANWSLQGLSAIGVLDFFRACRPDDRLMHFPKNLWHTRRDMPYSMSACHRASAPTRHIPGYGIMSTGAAPAPISARGADASMPEPGTLPRTT